MNKPIKKLARHLVTFEKGDDNEAVALAMLGLSNKAIKARVGNRLSDGQISYRLSKARRTEGNDQGYRVDYRNGTSPMANQIINDIAGILREEVRRNITPKLERATAEVIKL